MNLFKPLKRILGTAIMLLTGAAVLCACSGSPRGLSHSGYPAMSPVEEQPASLEDQSFALQVWSMDLGQSQHFVTTTFGEGLTVRSGAFYTSALGEQCRKAEFFRHNSPTPWAFAVCRSASTSNQYRVLPPLGGQ